MKRKHFEPITTPSEVETPTKRYKSRVDGKFYNGYCGSPDWAADIDKEMERTNSPRPRFGNFADRVRLDLKTELLLKEGNKPPKGITKEVLK